MASSAKMEKSFLRTSALELAKRSTKGVAVYPILALIEAWSGRIVDDHWSLTIGAIAFLAIAGAMRFSYAMDFEGRYKRVGEKAVFEFTVLTLAQSLTAGLLVAAIIHKYGVSRETALALLFGSGICAAGTSSLAPRPAVHLIFLASIMLPVFVSGLASTGIDEAPFLLAVVIFTAFMVREGSQAGAGYRELIVGRVALEEAAKELETLRGMRGP